MSGYSLSYLRKEIQQETFKSRSWKDFDNQSDYENKYNYHKKLKDKALKNKDYIKSNYHQDIMSAIHDERKYPSSKFKQLTFNYYEKKYKK
ncbi:MAG: hypothetical protein M0R46_16250 [Candidatus Muirbacterium halophilum]|nr:hypothetical protein [Candidatus Muirbacterium halophilum]MCK9477469.1 hypothetical protein [Candidatus Muirbacterium halophilum]